MRKILENKLKKRNFFGFSIENMVLHFFVVKINNKNPAENSEKYFRVFVKNWRFFISP